MKQSRFFFSRILLLFLWSNRCWQFDLWFFYLSKSSLNIWEFLVHTLLSLALVVSNSLWPYGLSPTRLLCSWGFSRQEYWNGLPCPPPGDLPNTGIKPMYLTFPALAGRFFTTTTWEAKSIQLTGKIILGIWIFWLKSRNLVQSKKCFLWLLLPQ